MTSRTRWSLLGSAAIGVLAAGLILPIKHSNCGGNSAALAACKAYVMDVRMWADEQNGQSFSYSHANSETKENLARLPGASWLWSARLLARVEKVRIDLSADKQIIIVCDRAYNNVPQHRFWKAPMTHAVGYSTGETGLITPQEFARLDLAGFVDLKTLGDKESFTR